VLLLDIVSGMVSGAKGAVMRYRPYDRSRRSSREWTGGCRCRAL
jgi:hypothetical protein